MRAMAAAAAIIAVSLLAGPAVPAAQQPTPPDVCTPAAGERQPIIDVHMHATGTPRTVVAGRIEQPSAPVKDVAGAVIAELDAHNVIAVIVSSPDLARTRDWVSRDPRFIPSLSFRDASMPLETARDLLQRHEVQALGELGFQYSGLSPDDPSLDGYFALAEELDVPVAIHMYGGGTPGVAAFRVRLGNPLLLEEVLVRHPKLRVNLMHAGLPFLDNTLAIMRRYPNVYADVGAITNPNGYPPEQFHEYLHSLLRANLGDRVMFGSDASGPGALGPSIDGILSAAFLDERQRRAILCGNAARFFRLTSRPRR